jgi:hypothetical protein
MKRNLSVPIIAALVIIGLLLFLLLKPIPPKSEVVKMLTPTNKQFMKEVKADPSASTIVVIANNTITPSKATIKLSKDQDMNRIYVMNNSNTQQKVTMSFPQALAKPTFGFTVEPTASLALPVDSDGVYIFSFPQTGNRTFTVNVIK